MRSATLLSRATELRLRVAEILEACTARVTARRAELAAVAALTLLFVVAGGLSLSVALLGLVGGGGAGRILAHRRARRRPPRGRARGQAGATDRLWRLVVDAVPEPAVALERQRRASCTPIGWPRSSSAPAGAAGISPP